MENADELRTVSVEDAADLIGAHPVVVYRWIRQRRFPGTKIGRKVRVGLRDLEAYLARNTSGRASLEEMNVNV